MEGFLLVLFVGVLLVFMTTCMIVMVFAIVPDVLDSLDRFRERRDMLKWRKEQYK